MIEGTKLALIVDDTSTKRLRYLGNLDSISTEGKAVYIPTVADASTLVAVMLLRSSGYLESRH